jgi:hypothetical protein
VTRFVNLDLDALEGLPDTVAPIELDRSVADQTFVTAACEGLPLLVASLRSARDAAMHLEEEHSRLEREVVELRAELAGAEDRADRWYRVAHTAPVERV